MSHVMYLPILEMIAVDYEIFLFYLITFLLTTNKISGIVYLR